MPFDCSLSKSLTTKETKNSKNTKGENVVSFVPFAALAVWDFSANLG
jgi:hypothetical protein